MPPRSLSRNRKPRTSTQKRVPSQVATAARGSLRLVQRRETSSPGLANAPPHDTQLTKTAAKLSLGDGVSVPKENLSLVFRNQHLIRVAVLGIFIGLGIYSLWWPSLLALGGLVVVAYSAWLLFLEGRGIMVDEQTLSFPTRPLPWLPIFALTRGRVRVGNVADLTYVGSWMGMERVLLNRRSDHQTLLFQDRTTRRLFFETMRRRFPTIEIYRVHRPYPG